MPNASWSATRAVNKLLARDEARRIAARRPPELLEAALGAHAD
jgi:hypothetical protein